MHRHRRAARRDRVPAVAVLDQMIFICSSRNGTTSVRTHTIRIICNRVINCIRFARGRQLRPSPGLALGPRLRLTSKEAIFDAETRCGGFVRLTCPSRTAFHFIIWIEFQPDDMEIDWKQRRSRNERQSGGWHWTAAARTQCEKIRYPRYPCPLFARSERRRATKKKSFNRLPFSMTDNSPFSHISRTFGGRICGVHYRRRLKPSHRVWAYCQLPNGLCRRRAIRRAEKRPNQYSSAIRRRHERNERHVCVVRGCASRRH